jgi:asparagine synthetase B (glutamine-hydrolysing)
MSGFAVVYNQQNNLALENMFKRIGHRGPYLSGKFEGQRVLMAQNYLKGDITEKPDSVLDKKDVPAYNPRFPELRSCRRSRRSF